MTSGADPFAALGAVGPRPAARLAAPARQPIVALPQAIRQWREAAIGWVRVDDADTAGLLAARPRRPDRPRW